MTEISRRSMIAAAGGAMMASPALAQPAAAPLAAPPPQRGTKGADILGPSNGPRAAEEPFTQAPPATDHGTMPNLKWSFTDSHMRLE